MSGFLDDADRLTKKFIDDKDYATAEQRFSDEIDAARASRLGDIDDHQLRSRTELMMKRSSIEAGGTVRTSVITKQKDIAVAGNSTRSRTTRFAGAITAPSDVARIAVIDEYGAETNRAVAAGWIDHRTAVARGLKFSQQLQNADAMAAIQKDPAAAALRLQDPAQFPALDPVTRQSYITHAIGQAESNTTAQWVGDAHHNPVRSQMAIGRVSTPDQARNIFDAGILKVENAAGQAQGRLQQGRAGPLSNPAGHGARRGSRAWLKRRRSAFRGRSQKTSADRWRAERAARTDLFSTDDHPF